MIDWIWYLIGGAVGSSATFFMLWVMVKLKRIDIKFL